MGLVLLLMVLVLIVLFEVIVFEDVVDVVWVGEVLKFWVVFRLFSCSRLGEVLLVSSGMFSVLMLMFSVLSRVRLRLLSFEFGVVGLLVCVWFSVVMLSLLSSGVGSWMICFCVIDGLFGFVVFSVFVVVGINVLVRIMVLMVMLVMVLFMVLCFCRVLLFSCFICYF